MFKMKAFSNLIFYIKYFQTDSEQETCIHSNKKDKLLFSQGKKSLFIYFENNSWFNFFIATMKMCRYDI